MAVSDLPEAVARETLDKLGRKAIVRPGRLAKILEAAFTGVPRWGRVKIMSQVMKGMTSGDREPAAPTSVQHMNRPAS